MLVIPWWKTEWLGLNVPMRTYCGAFSKTTPYFLCCVSAAVYPLQVEQSQSILFPSPIDSSTPFTKGSHVPNSWSRVSPNLKGYRLGSLLRHHHEIGHFMSFLQNHDARWEIWRVSMWSNCPFSNVPKRQTLNIWIITLTFTIFTLKWNEGSMKMHRRYIV